MLVDSVPMLRSWLTFSCKMLLLLFGVQLSIAAFFLLPSYIEYARDTQHLGVDLHHILVGDRVTNVGAAFCVLFPAPVLCSFGRAHSVRPLAKPVPDSTYPAPLPSAFPPTTVPGACVCLTDTLVGHHVLFGQLELSIVSTERSMAFLASSPVSCAAAHFAREAASLGEGSPLHEEIGVMLDRVHAALHTARQATNRVVISIEIALSQYVHSTFQGYTCLTNTPALALLIVPRSLVSRLPTSCTVSYPYSIPFTLRTTLYVV